MLLRLFNRKRQTPSLRATGGQLDARVCTTTEWRASRITAETTRKQHWRIRMMSHDLQSVALTLVCHQEGHPRCRRDHSHPDEAVRRARDPVDREQPSHLPGNAIYHRRRRRIS
jgi:hypothetical protein